MKSRKMIIQIIMIIVAGLATVALSIIALVEGDQKERESKETQRKLQEAQHQLIQKQEETNQKSDKIIELQNKLKELADSSQRELNKLKYPVPQKAEISMSMELNLPETSLNTIRSGFEQNPNQSNLITRELATMWGLGVEVERLFGASFRAALVLKANENRELRFLPQQQPMKFVSTLGIDNNSFLLYYDREADKLRFDAFVLETDVQSFDSISMYDYKDSEVSVSVQFAYPGDIGGKILYFSSIAPEITVDLKKLQFNSTHYAFEITEFLKSQANNFTSKVSIELS